jgi:hypothetical protein
LVISSSAHTFREARGGGKRFELITTFEVSPAATGSVHLEEGGASHGCERRRMQAEPHGLKTGPKNNPLPFLKRELHHNGIL